MSRTAGVLMMCAAFLLGVPLAGEAQPTVTLTVGDSAAAEAGQETGSFTVTRDGGGATAANLEVWVTLGGTATIFSDYVTSNLSILGGGNYTVLIEGGQLSRTVTLTPIKDNSEEGNETFTVELRAAVTPGHDYIIGEPNSGQITIADDVAEVTLTLDDGTAAEAGQETGSFTVTRNSGGATAANLEVWVTLGGTATIFSDYTPGNGLSVLAGGNYNVLIEGGQLSRTVTLTPVFEENIEGDETFAVMLREPLTPGHDYTIGVPSQAEIVILDFIQVFFKDSFENP